MDKARIIELDEETRLFLEYLSALQKVDPYSGWDIGGINLLFVEVSILLEEIESSNISLSKEMILLKRFSECRVPNPKDPNGGFGWNMLHLNRLSDRIRMHLDLPSIESLNPELFRVARDVDPFRLLLNKNRVPLIKRFKK